MKRSTLLFVFVLGLLAGAALHRLCASLERPRPPRPEEIAERLAGELALDDAQKARVLEIFRRNDPKIRALRASALDQFDAIRKDMDAQIEGMLTPVQKDKFRVFQARMTERLKEWDGAGPPHP
jgi:hypothetical protein